jgi:hypothetical protein
VGGQGRALCALGITSRHHVLGTKALLGLTGGQESEACWTTFLRVLVSHGLRGACLDHLRRSSVLDAPAQQSIDLVRTSALGGILRMA